MMGLNWVGNVNDSPCSVWGDMREIISPDSYLINLSRCAGHALWLQKKKKEEEEEAHI